MSFRIYHKNESLNSFNAKKALDLIYDLLNENEIKPRLCYGTLLGAVRSQDFIKHDGDIDLVIMKEEQLKASNLIRKIIEGKKFVCEDDVIKIELFGVPVDVYCLNQNWADKLLSRYTWKHGWKKRDIRTLHFCHEGTFVTIQGKDYMSLNFKEDFLKKIYGRTWRIPKNKKGSSWTTTTEIRYFLTVYRKYKVRIFIKKFRLFLKKSKFLYLVYGRFFA
jgi:hypothetical protein